jgi:nicotinate phosphoribosyltransferase
MKDRLNQEVFKIDKRVAEGYYSDAYFNKTKEILLQDDYHPILKMQVFQRNDNVCLCGIDEAITILKESLGEDFKELKVMALHDGDIITPWETVMTIEGDYSLFAHLETVYLGALARGTRVATNVYRCVKAAGSKDVLFFPARFDSHLVQAKDGYSFKVGRTAGEGMFGGGVSTDAQGEWWGSKGIGTIPHALIAAYEGNTVKAALKFAESIDPAIRRVVLVDFDNDCVQTTLDVAEAMLDKYKETNDERYRLYGVRLDTSATMVDKSVRQDMDKNEYLGSFPPGGVNPQLVLNVYYALSRKCHEFEPGTMPANFYAGIGIVVSGGFTPEKIAQFEAFKLPVIAYGVGSSLFNGNFDFTADIVERYEPAQYAWGSESAWVHNAKKGRRFNVNPKLKRVL